MKSIALLTLATIVATASVAPAVAQSVGTMLPLTKYQQIFQNTIGSLGMMPGVCRQAGVLRFRTAELLLLLEVAS